MSQSVVKSSSAVHYGCEGTALQDPFDVAVVMPTIMRPQLKQAMYSVFQQKFSGRVQLLIGIDKSDEDRAVLDEICAATPNNYLVTVVDLGYSTSVRHGGLHQAQDGGALRTILSYMANSRYIAYLDDDNWWLSNHLQTMCDAIQGHDWTYSLRWYVDPETDQPHCLDQWESVGPGKGAFKDSLGGFVDPNCLMIDKTKCEFVLPLWCIPASKDPKGMDADRNVFAYLHEKHRYAATNKATVVYRLDIEDKMHEHRRALMASPDIIKPNFC